MARKTLSKDALRKQFETFKENVRLHSEGAEFSSFDTGLAYEWEGYKMPLRDHALGLLGADEWRDDDIGTGTILEAVVRAIEIDGRAGVRNNLVSWQNRYGHANRSHHALLDAQVDEAKRARFEELFLGLYAGKMSEAEALEQLRAMAGGRYDLLGYLFFLRDAERFMPIRTTVFDKAFARLGVDLATNQRCSWENYAAYNAALSEVRDGLGDLLEGPLRLIDAHSFCWMLVRLDERKPGSATSRQRRRQDGGRSLTSRDKSIFEMVRSVEQTVAQALGPAAEKQPKPKELRMTTGQLREHIARLIDTQEGKCALTGIELQWRGDETDPQLLPSLDRIDSERHYEAGNLQVVCRFINFWKGASDNEEFRGLLALVRGVEG